MYRMKKIHALKKTSARFCVGGADLVGWLVATSDPSCCWAMFFVFRLYFSYFQFYVARVRMA